MGCSCPSTWASFCFFPMSIRVSRSEVELPVFQHGMAMSWFWSLCLDSEPLHPNTIGFSDYLRWKWNIWNTQVIERVNFFFAPFILVMPYRSCKSFLPPTATIGLEHNTAQDFQPCFCASTFSWSAHHSSSLSKIFLLFLCQAPDATLPKTKEAGRRKKESKNTF